MPPSGFESLIADLQRSLPETLAHALPNIKALPADAEARIHRAIETALTGLQVVSRKDFDIQTQVLARTRSKLDALEQRVAELEAASKPSNN